MKGFFKFIVVFIILIAIYFSIILNINYFIVSYNGKLERYTNPYYKYKDTESIFYKLGTFIETAQNISDRNIEVIKNSKIIKNILKNIDYVEESKLDKYINKLKQQNNITLVDNDIIYISTQEYGMAFSFDTNNIAYELRRNFASVDAYTNQRWEPREITMENKNEIYAKVQRKLEELGITEKFKFEPETIYYYNMIDLDQEIYIIEDTKNHIKVKIQLPDYEIIYMQIGFQYFGLRA